MKSLVRHVLQGAGVLALVVGLSSCSSIKEMVGSKAEQMACPDIRIDRDTGKITSFAPNGGQDITDIQYEANIETFNGDCGWDPKTRTIDVKMKVLFQITRGPAMTGMDGEFTYFVAIPAFFPSATAKQVMPVKFRFNDGNLTTVNVRDEEVRVHIPLGTDLNSSDTPVYIGFQLTDQQLQFNRKLNR